MKILKSIGMALVAILLCVNFTSCEKEPILTLSVQQITAPSSGNSTKVLVNANNPWTVSGNDWCTVSPSSGEGGEVSVTVTVKENTTYNDRNCTLTFTSEGLMASISVSQESNYGIVLPKDTYNVSSDAQQISVEVKANVEYDITIDAGWIKQSGTKALTSKTVTFDIEKNSTYDNREGIITIKEKNGNDIKTIKVKQVQVDAIIISSKEYSLSSKAQSLEVKLQTNVDLDIVIPDNAKTWVSHNSTKALSDKTVIFDIKENEDYSTRACEIILKKKNDTYADTIKIEQAQKDAIILSQKEYKLSSEKHTLEVKLQTNVDIEVNVPESAKSWISMVETKALVDKTIVFDIKENTDYSARNCDVIITQNNSSIADTIKIEQAQKDVIVISQKEYEVAATGETIEVKLSANIEFDINMPEADWIKQINTRALQEHTLYFEVEENQEVLNRSAKIVFLNKESKISDTISIKQQNPLGKHKVWGDYTGLYCEFELYRAGALKSMLELYKLLDKNSQLTKMTVSGPINGDDIIVLNKVYSSSSKFEIDISEAIIVEGGSSYYENYYTKNNEIGKYMFAESKAIIINLPKSATTIEGYAFQNSNLITIRTGNGITSIKDYAFSKTNKLRNIYIGEGVTRLDSYAFRECSSLMVLDISIGTPSIADYAFRSIPVTDVHISNNVTTIGKESFAFCKNLINVTIGDGVTKIGESAFDSCEALNSITMGKSVISIGNHAFAYCKLLTYIDIPNSVKEIGEFAFKGTSLSYIDIANGLTKIGDYAFSETSLIYAVLPNSLTDIGDYTFKNCPKLTRLYCNATVPPSGNITLNSDVHIYVPYQSVDAYKTCDNWKTYAKNITGYDSEQDEVGIDLSKCKVGDFINYKGVNCVVFYAEKDAVKLISATVNLSCEWGLSGQLIGAYDTKEGSVNAAKAKSKGLFDSLPAFVWCESLGDGWYLPSSGELGQLAKNRYSVEVALEDMNYTPLMGREYWSSTEPDGTGKYACSLDFSYHTANVTTYNSSKNSKKSVRAVMTIKK